MFNIKKNEALKYNKIAKKIFENQNNKFKAMYLEKNLNKNILEIGLLLKPENIFLFINIDISDKNAKLEEDEYCVDKDKYKNILSRFKRSFCGKYIFTNKETNQKYLIYKDYNNKEMVVKELEINHISDNNNKNGNNFYYIYNIGDKTYMIAEIQDKNEEQNNNNIIFGIYNLIYDKEKDKYLISLIQQIKIKNEDGTKEYLINIDSSNSLSVNFKESVIFILFDEKGSVDSINKIKIIANNLEISKICSEKYKEWSLFVLFIKDEIYFSKLSDEFEKLGKWIINYEIKSNDNIDNKIDTSNENQTNEKENIKKSHKKHKEENNEIVEEESISIEYDNKMKDLLEEIIKKRIDKNMKKIEKLKKENDKKIKMIKDDINMQFKENEMFEKKCNDLFKCIKELNKMKNENNEENEEEEEKELNINSNKNKNINNNYYNNNLHFNSQQNLNKINIMNNPQINHYRQMNQDQMMNQYNNVLNSNLQYINNKLNLNDPTFILLLQQQQQRNLLNQGNYFLPNMNNNFL